MPSQPNPTQHISIGIGISIAPPNNPTTSSSKRTETTQTRSQTEETLVLHRYAMQKNVAGLSYSQLNIVAKQLHPPQAAGRRVQWRFFTQHVCSTGVARCCLCTKEYGTRPGASFVADRGCNTRFAPIMMVVSARWRGGFSGMGGVEVGGLGGGKVGRWICQGR